MKYRAYKFRDSGFKVTFGTKKTIIKKGDEQIIISNRHLVYLVDIRNMFDYYFNALIVNKKSNLYTLDFSSAKKHVFKRTGLSFYFSSVPEDDWEIDEYLNRYTIKKGDIIFDIGSYCGYSVYNFSKETGEKGKVYSFEPDGENYKILTKNTKTHNLKNVVTVNKAMWSKTTTISFFEEGALGSSAISMGYRPNHTKQTNIETLSLKDSFKLFNLKKIDFVKMDAEGAEIEIISGSLEFIKQQNINFAISCHPRNVKGRSINTSEILLKLFDKIGYKSQVKRFDYRTYEATLIYARP